LVQVSAVRRGKPAELEIARGGLKAIKRSTVKARLG
jgi:hypothetical protein